MYLENENSGAAIQISDGMMSWWYARGMYSLESYQIKCNILNGMLTTKLERVISSMLLCG